MRHVTFSVLNKNYNKNYIFITENKMCSNIITKDIHKFGYEM